MRLKLKLGLVVFFLTQILNWITLSVQVIGHAIARLPDIAHGAHVTTFYYDYQYVPSVNSCMEDQIY